MEMLNNQITSIPIWVKFFNIRLEYWTVTSLGYIASAVGIPLHLDTPTENHSRLSFARICIEVDVNCEFPKSALLDLGNGKYSNLRIEYPWVPQKCSHCKIFGHSRLKCHVVEGMGSEHNGIGHATDNVNDAGSTLVSRPDSVVSNIGDLITTPAKDGTDVSRKVNGADSPTRLTGNPFECLASCEDADTLDLVVDLVPSSYGSFTVPDVTSPTLDDIIPPISGVGSLEPSRLDIPSVAEFSDSSPTCEAFKHIKRIDELDYPSLPMSKKKLKNLKKQIHVAKSANPSSDANTNIPYIMEID